MGAITGIVRNLLLKPRRKLQPYAAFLASGAFVVLGYSSFVAMRGTIGSFVYTLAYLVVMLFLVLPVYALIARRRPL
jgi:hypothetical protein